LSTPTHALPHRRGRELLGKFQIFLVSLYLLILEGFEVAGFLQKGGMYATFPCWVRLVVVDSCPISRNRGWS
jgi:hypothetical protein